MITDADIKKIKRVVVIKDDLKSMEGRLVKKFATKDDLDDLGAHIITAISKTLEDYPKKEDLKKEVNKLEEKIIKLDGKIDDVAGDVSDIRRRVIDLETDSVTRREFNDFKTKILPA